MKYEPEKELRVLWIIQEKLGLASIEEVDATYEETFHEKLANTNLILRRWKAKKALTIEDGRYKMADVPPWFKSLNRAQLLHTSKTESKEYLKELEELFTGGQAPIKHPPQYRNFIKLELTFENLDPILGGTPTENMGKTSFPHEDDRLVVPINWLYGLTRDNQSLIDVSGLHRHIAWGKGYWQGSIDMITCKAPVVSNGKGVGIAEYESIPAHNQFKVKMMLPLKGSAIDSVEKLTQWLSLLEETPIRGLGANPKAYGGRIKLVNMQEL